LPPFDAKISLAIPVHEASALPAASCRFNLVMDILAVWLTVPAAKSVGDFPTEAVTPCRAHKIKGHL